MLAGKTIGSLEIARSISSISATFHRSRRICHTPREKVTMGTRMTRRFNGRRNGERRRVVGKGEGEEE